MMDDTSRSAPRREKKKMFAKKKVCRFCADQHLRVSYRDIHILRGFITERGKIIPRRISGNCAVHQHLVTREIKRSRMLALLPFTAIASMQAEFSA